jgi:hypothetical protein
MQPDVSLKEYLLELLDERKAEFNTRFESMDRAINVATEALDKRLDSMNEFRNALKDQTATFITKSDYQSKHDELVKQIEDLKLSRATMEGKADQNSVNIAYIITFIGLIISIISLLLRFLK